MKSPSNEQQQSVRMIRDSVQAVFPPQGGLSRIRELRFGSPGFEPAVYRDMCRLGWTGVRVAHEFGGAGLGLTELCTIAQGLGAALVPEPVVPVAIAARFLRGEPLARALNGEFIVMPAWAERVGAIGIDCETTLEGGRVRGRKRFVPFAAHVDALLVSTREGMALVRRDAPGVSVRSHTTQDGGNIGDIVFDNAPAEPVRGSFADVLNELTLANAHYLFGSMERILDITFAYLGVRHQFGKPIGSFQALQHRSVDLKIQLELTRAVLREAAAVLDDEGDPRLRAMAVSRAAARACDTAMTAAREAIQLHGAIGMTDECDVGLFTRKVLTGYNLYGTSVAHRQRYLGLHAQKSASGASEGGDAGAAGGADETSQPADYNAWDDDVFRRHVQAWLSKNYPEELRYPLERLHRRDTKVWYDALIAKGWLAPGWPKEIGGMGLSPAKQLIMLDVTARHGCARFSDHGVNQLGPLIIRFGTSAQRAFFLPRIMSAEHIWCQGYSEPNAGSDLASLRTEAVLDGDYWVINGQKIWTTLATDANWIYMLVRTDKSVKKQDGISFMLVPMTTPGITVRPIMNIGMNPEFCEVFFDNVRVPRDSLVGQVNQGWSMAKALLGFERLFVGSPAQSAVALEQLNRLAGELGLRDDPVFGERFGRLLLDLEDHSSLFQIYMDKVRRGEELGPDVSMLKVNQTELYKRITQTMIDVGAEYAAFRLAPSDEMTVTPAALWIQSLITTIYGGTSEVQRNILAKQVLHLPS